MLGSERIGRLLAVALPAPGAFFAADALLAQTAADSERPVSAIPAVPHVTGPVDIDGSLDDPIWREALVIALDMETNPRENEPAPVETFVYVAENGTHLLVAFDARDPDPTKIRAYLNDRDSSYNDDFVGIILDTFNDQRRAFEFFVNPLGVQMDLTLDDLNGGESDAWDAIWESNGRITDAGYTVEMAIPFSQLRFQRTPTDQTWGFEALRMYPRDDRLRLSATPRDRGRNCYLCQLDKVRGFASVEPGRGLEVVPSLTATRNDTRDPDVGGLVSGDTESEVGLNVRWAVTPDLVANLAINPDFSQVEADVPQLEVNNQFALYYPETRPFFLDGADYFATPMNAVFTRTIADPDLGAKLTGALGDNSFGLLAAEDTITNLLFPSALGSASHSLEQANTTLIGRYRWSFGANSALGALLTSRSGDDYHNHVAGIDGRYRVNDEHSLSFQYLASDTAYPDEIVADFGQPAGGFRDDAFRINYDFGTREWNAGVNYRNFGPGFRADSGFISQVGVESAGAGVNRIWHGDGTHWWNQLRVGGNVSRSERTDGQVLEEWNELFFAVQGPRQWFMQTGLYQGRQFWDGTLYDASGFWGYTQARPFRGVNLNMNWTIADQIDFANSRLGKERRLAPSINLNAGAHLRLGMQYTWSQLDTDAGERIFDADLVDLRLTWQFNVRSFLRFTQQRQNVNRNLAVYVNPNGDAVTKTRALQVLYSYQLNPQTVVYAGYSDNFRWDADLVDLVQKDRTFFLKLSYAWLP